MPRAKMKVAKDFRWEAAHRIPWYEGACRHLHGHSYRLTVGLEGEPDGRGMVMDFRHIKVLMRDLVGAMDHAVLVAEGDDALRKAMRQLDTKTFVLPYDTTSENLCRYVADHLGTHAYEVLLEHRVQTLHIRLQETETCYAELAQPVAAYAPAAAEPELAAQEA